MSRVLILPAGIYQLPAVLKAKDLGCRVITADNNPQNPGHKYADRCEFISASEQESILALAQEENIDAIFTMASDIALKTVAHVSRVLGLNETVDPEYLDTIYLKNKFRHFQQNSGFHSPVFYSAASFNAFKLALSELGLPAIIKPAEASGSRGLYYLDKNSAYTDNELREMFRSTQSYSRNGIVCLEQFIAGEDISGDALIIDGRIVFCAITNKYLTPAPEFIPIGHSIPSLLSAAKKADIKALLQQAVKALRIKNGGLNFDIIVAEGADYIIEMSPRLGGNCIQNIINHGTGLDIVEAALLIALGKKPQIREYITGPTGVRILRSSRDGFFISHSDLSELKREHPGIIEIRIDVQPGAAVRRFTEGAHRIGHVICKADSVRELERELDNVEEALNIRVGGMEPWQ